MNDRQYYLAMYRHYFYWATGFILFTASGRHL